MANKRFLLFILLGIFMISFSSAFDFDNTYEYTEENETAVIHNCDFWMGVCLNQGEALSELRLIWGDTLVPRGKDVHVGTFAFTPYVSESASSFNNLNLINVKAGGSLSRNRQYKVKVAYEEEVVDYAEDCTNLEIDGVCMPRVTGSHFETRYKWLWGDH